MSWFQVATAMLWISAGLLVLYFGNRVRKRWKKDRERKNDILLHSMWGSMNEPVISDSYTILKKKEDVNEPPDLEEDKK